MSTELIVAIGFVSVLGLIIMLIIGCKCSESKVKVKSEPTVGKPQNETYTLTEAEVDEYIKNHNESLLELKDMKLSIKIKGKRLTAIFNPEPFMQTRCFYKDGLGRIRNHRDNYYADHSNYIFKNGWIYDYQRVNQKDQLSRRSMADQLNQSTGFITINGTNYRVEDVSEYKWSEV